MFIDAAMVCGAVALGSRFRLYSFATIAIVVAFRSRRRLARPSDARSRQGWASSSRSRLRDDVYATMLWLAVPAIPFLRGRPFDRVPTR